MSSDKTAGQWAGTIIGAVIGAYAGGNAVQGAMLGASLGGAVGGLIDPPKGPTIRGPRVEDLSIQNAQYGSPLARIYGTVGVMGTVIWVENNKIKEKIKKKKQGGKGGGGGSTVETYSYSGTFAIALGDAPPEGISAIRRVWVGPDLIYNAGSDDLETVIASNKSTAQFRFYSGADDQMPDPRIESEMGVGNASAYRGTPYIVFYDLPLAKYGNSLMGAQVKVELISQISTAVDVLKQVTVYGDIDSDSGCVNPFNAKKKGFAVTEAPGSFTGQSGQMHVIGLNSIQQKSVPRSSDIPTSRSVFVVEGVSDRAEYWISDSGGIVSDHTLYSNLGSVFMGSRISVRIYDITDTGIYLLNRTWSGAGTWRLTKLEYTAIGYVLSNYIDAELDQTDSIESSAIAVGGGRVVVFDPATSTTITVQVFDQDLVHEKTFIAPWYSTGGTSANNTTPAIIVESDLYILGKKTSDSISILRINIDSETVVGEFTFNHVGIGSVASFQFMTLGYQNGVFVLAAKDPVNGKFDFYYLNLTGVNAELPALADVVRSELERSELITPADIDVTDLESDFVRGYRPAGVQQVRACIGPLQLAYPFDLIMDGYQIKAVRRGAHSSVATIPAEMLDARAYGDATGIQFDQQREMDSQLPRQVVLRHIDAEREYEVNEQRSAERMSAQSVDVREIDLALVLTPDEAAQIADIEQTRNWLERTPATFRLPPEYLHLQPADVVTIETDYGSFELLLGEIAYTPDGRLECASRPNAAASYTSPAVGGQGPIPDGEIPLVSDALTVLLDIPLIRNEDDEPGFAAAMAGESNSWPGGGLFRSNDSGQTWADVQAWNAPVTMGVARDALPVHDGLTIDRINSLTIDTIGGELEAITEAQMMTGLNWCAYGADGRWELMRFVDHTLNPDGSSTISTLARGLRGSEWATGLHEYGDVFVLLDDADVMAIGADIASLNIVRQWRGISIEQTIDDAESIEFAYKGENLRPLSPVNVSGVRAGQDWVISWMARSRLQGSLWKTGVPIPVGEASESYEVDIYDGADAVRTITATDSAITYTEAQQIEDFGAVQQTISIAIYQMSATVGRGRAFTGTFVASSGVTVLELNFGGADGSTTFTDSSPAGRTLTAVGNAQIDTSLGGQTGLFDGTGDWCTMAASNDFAFGLGDFTIEGWVYPTSSHATGWSSVFANFDNATSGSYGFWLKNTRVLIFGTYPGQDATTTDALPLNSWSHLAVSRNGGDLRIFINGEQKAINSSYAAVSVGANVAPRLGSSNAGTATNDAFRGHMAEIKMTKGEGKYTSNFNPGATPF